MLAAITSDRSLRKKCPEDLDTQLKGKHTKGNWKPALALRFPVGLLHSLYVLLVSSGLSGSEFMEFTRAVFLEASFVSKLRKMACWWGGGTWR